MYKEYETEISMTLDFVVKGRYVDIYCVNIYYLFLLIIVHLLISHLARILLLREDVSVFIVHVQMLPVVFDMYISCQLLALASLSHLDSRWLL